MENDLLQNQRDIWADAYVQLSNDAEMESDPYCKCAIFGRFDTRFEC